MPCCYTSNLGIPATHLIIPGHGTEYNEPGINGCHEAQCRMSEMSSQHAVLFCKVWCDDRAPSLNSPASKGNKLKVYAKASRIPGLANLFLFKIFYIEVIT